MSISPRIHYQQGDHVCTLYADRDEQMAAAVEYILGGLDRGERCLYVVGEHTPDEFRDGLRAAGIDVEREELAGRSCSSPSTRDTSGPAPSIPTP